MEWRRLPFISWLKVWQEETEDFQPQHLFCPFYREWSPFHQRKPLRNSFIFHIQRVGMFTQTYIFFKRGAKLLENNCPFYEVIVRNALLFFHYSMTLDTPGNRKGMPNADFTQWTPLDYVAA